MALVEECHHAARRLRHNPAVSCGAIVILSGAIGVTTLLFSLVNGVLLRALPFRGPERLVTVLRTFDDGSSDTVPYRDYGQWRLRTGVFEDVAGISWDIVEIGSDATGTRRAQAGWVTPNFFRALGPQTLLGRPDRRPNADRTVVITEGLWRRHFASDPKVVDRHVRINSLLDPPCSGDYVVSAVVRGGIKARASGLTDYDLFISYGSSPPRIFSAATGGAFDLLIGRLKSHVTVGQASAAAARLGRELADTQVTGVRDGAVRSATRNVTGGYVTPLHEWQVGWTRHGFVVLAVAVLLVLLMACINLGALLVARSLGRSHELGVRSALGASRWRLIRDVLADHLLLGIAGGLGGVALALAGMPLLLAVVPSNLPRVADVGIDRAALAVAVLSDGLAVVLLALLAPAIVSHCAAKGNVRRCVFSKTRRGRGRNVFLALQITLTEALLVGTLLAVQSAWNLAHVPLGFDPTGVVTAELSLGRYAADGAASAALLDRLLERVRRVAGVQWAALANRLPPGARDSIGIMIPGVGGNSKSGYVFVPCRMVTRDYFDVLGIKVLRGRRFRDGERDAVLVNDSFARTFFRHQDALEQRIFVSRWERVVGIVADAREEDSTRAAGPTLYWSVHPGATVLWLAIRSSLRAGEIEPIMRDVIAGVDPQLPASIKSLEAQLNAGQEPVRFYAVLLSIFAVYALVLAGTGIFTVSQYTVYERTHEFGVRLALGARPAQIKGAVLSRITWIAGPALLVGAILGLVGARLLRSLVFGVTVSDPATLIASVALLALLALLAAFGPARSAASLDPSVMLRRE